MYHKCNYFLTRWYAIPEIILSSDGSLYTQIDIDKYFHYTEFVVAPWNNTGPTSLSARPGKSGLRPAITFH